jgi:hypothetical protein
VELVVALGPRAGRVRLWHPARRVIYSELT